MILRKYLFIFLGTLLISLAASGNANKASSNSHSSITQCITGDEAQEPEHVLTMQGLLNPAIKLSETTPSFKNLNQHKKDLLQHRVSVSYGYQTVSFRFYSALRDNNFSSTPFYIAYHRLTV